MTDQAETRLRALRHQFRTPVNHIVGYCELLLEESRNRGRTDIVVDLERIHAASTQLLQHIEGILSPATKDDDTSDQAAIQHELRTPLNQIIGYSELLQEEASDRGIEDLVPDLQRINIAARQLLSLGIQHVEGTVPSSPTHRARGDAGPLHPSIFPIPRLQQRAERGTLLIVDDDAMNQDMLSRRLHLQGHQVSVVESGQAALDLLRRELFDLILLDVVMPGMDGYAVLQKLKQDVLLRHIPVLMLSALDDIESVVRCIEMGADDYLHKPFDPTLLRARIDASLEKKRLRDQEQSYLAAIKQEQERSQHLLLNILPIAIVERLKKDEGIIADAFPQATILFADITGFTRLSSHVAPAALVESLNAVFSSLDEIVVRHGLEKIKMIGDAYMAVAGVPLRRPDHAEAAAEMALEIQQAVTSCSDPDGRPYGIRIGIDSGPVIAGVIGTRKFAYDLWGDAVNTASRMETYAPPGCIQVTSRVFECLRGKYQFEARRPIRVKGKGTMHTYLLRGRLVEE